MDDCGIGGQRYMYSWTKIWMIVELVHISVFMD